MECITARTQLAASYAQWTERAAQKVGQGRASYGPRPDNGFSTVLADDINRHMEAVQNMHNLTGSAANTMVEKTTEALRKGMEQFIRQRQPRLRFPLQRSAKETRIFSFNAVRSILWCS